MYSLENPNRLDDSTYNLPQPYNKIGDGPEAPEVKLIVEEMDKKFKNSILKDIAILGGRYLRHNRPVGYKKFLEDLPSKILDFNNKGKFIWITMENGSYIWITFGLTGQLSTEKDKHSHIKFETNKGNFYFEDMRNFGTIKFVFSKKETEKKLKQLGFDPLTEKIDRDEFIKKIRKQKPHRLIALVLMDQKVLSGIGNYLRAEILYDAKISPYRTVESLSDKDLEKILHSINKIVKESYKFQKKKGLHTYPFKVYQKGNDPLVRSDDLEERTIWWVPSVQK